MSEPGGTAQKVGEGIQGCGCVLMLIPLLVICVIILYAVVASVFR